MAPFKFGGAFSNTLLPQSQSTLLLKELIKMMAYFASKIYMGDQQTKTSKTKTHNSFWQQIGCYRYRYWVSDKGRQGWCTFLLNEDLKNPGILKITGYQKSFAFFSQTKIKSPLDPTPVGSFCFVLPSLKLTASRPWKFWWLEEDELSSLGPAIF